MAFTYKRLNISGGDGTGDGGNTVKVTSTDVLSDFLNEKLVTGSSKITKEVLNLGGVEQLEIDIDDTQIDHNATLNYNIDEHRLMDDNVTSLQSLWSSQKTKTYVDDTATQTNEAIEISYDNTGSGLTSTDVQNALDEVNTKIENIEQGSLIELRVCDLSAQVLDLVYEDDLVANKVISATDNNNINPIMGIIIEKPTGVSCKVLLFGRVSGFTGLQKGKKVFLNTDGTVTSTVVSTGYLHCLGTAKEADTILFNPDITRVKRT